VRSEKSEVKLACWERGLTRRREGLEGRGLGEGLVGRVGRRTPCAGRAVILTAVQSLRLLVRRTPNWGSALPGACGEGGFWGEGMVRGGVD
jgi:hypothetical protein